FGEDIDECSGPGAFFGEVALLEHVKRTATIVCKSEACSTYQLMNADLERLFEEQPDFKRIIYDISQERMQKNGTRRTPGRRPAAEALAELPARAVVAIARHLCFDDLDRFAVVVDRLRRRRRGRQQQQQQQQQSAGQPTTRAQVDTTLAQPEADAWSVLDLSGKARDRPLAGVFASQLFKATSIPSTLRALSLRGCGIPNAASAWCAFSETETLGLHPIKPFPALVQLDLAWTPSLTSDTLVWILKACPALEWLCIDGCPLLGAQALHAVAANAANLVVLSHTVLPEPTKADNFVDVARACDAVCRSNPRLRAMQLPYLCLRSPYSAPQRPPARPGQSQPGTPPRTTLAVAFPAVRFVPHRSPGDMLFWDSTVQMVPDEDVRALEPPVASLALALASPADVPVVFAPVMFPLASPVALGSFVSTLFGACVITRRVSAVVLDMGGDRAERIDADCGCPFYELTRLELGAKIRSLGGRNPSSTPASTGRASNGEEAGRAALVMDALAEPFPSSLLDAIFWSLSAGPSFSISVLLPIQFAKAILLADRSLPSVVGEISTGHLSNWLVVSLSHILLPQFPSVAPHIIRQLAEEPEEDFRKALAYPLQLHSLY
ncbi:hypothetical protein HK405_008197, partial [Cladochytrium tenue]